MLVPAWASRDLRSPVPPVVTSGVVFALSTGGRATLYGLEGATGKELKTVAYEPGRHDDGLMWGDYAMARIEPGNRVDRFLAGVAYLDGKKPAAVFARGYYTRSTLVAYRWNGHRLVQDWYVDSGWTPMTTNTEPTAEMMSRSSRDGRRNSAMPTSVTTTTKIDTTPCPRASTSQYLRPSRRYNQSNARSSMG